MSEARFIGRFRHAAGVTRVADASVGTTKTKIATYSGAHYVAEREGEELCVYAIGDQSGLPETSVLGNTTGDAGRIVTLADLNKVNAARRGEVVV